MMEICAADGSIKTIEVSAAEYGFEEEPQEQMTHMKSDCGFCFAFDDQKFGLSGNDVHLRNPVQNHVIETASLFFFSTTALYQEARGPPVLFS